MKQNFQDQFNTLRKIIQGNVSALNDLVKQSDNLSNIIRTINGNQGNDELKKQLEETKSNISDSIKRLIDQTDKLFEAYTKLTEEVFGKK